MEHFTQAKHTKTKDGGNVYVKQNKKKLFGGWEVCVVLMLLVVTEVILDVRKLIDISRDDRLCLMWSVVVVVVQRKNKESTM